MKKPRLVWLHYTFLLRQLMRTPAYVLPTLAFPVLFYVFFGVPNSPNPIAARVLIASFCTFGVLGVAVFQFGVGIANERGTSWERYMRTLDVGPGIRFGARQLVAMTFALATTALVVACGVIFTRAAFSVEELAVMLLVLLAGSIPMTLLGTLIGYWASARSAIPIANLVYLPLSFIGGLWVPPKEMPVFLAHVSTFTPVRSYVDMVWAAALGAPIPERALVMLALYAVIFGGVALLGYLRDESRRYA